MKRAKDNCVVYYFVITKYLTGLLKKIEQPKLRNTTVIMSFAGSWSDMEEDDFVDFLTETRNTRNNLFDRKVDI